MQNRQKETCLPPERIEALRTGEGEAADAAHLAECAGCREVLRQMERLAASLRGMRSEATPPPVETDMAILEAFSREFDRDVPAGTKGLQGWRWMAAGAAAAALFVAASVPLWWKVPEKKDIVAVAAGERFSQRREGLSSASSERAEAKRAAAPDNAPGEKPLPGANISGDLTGDGRVDVLDAFRLALTLERGGGATDPAWDVDGDGRVDDADVEHLARLAVSLGG